MPARKQTGLQREIELAGRNTRRSRGTTKPALLSKRRNVGEAEKFPQNDIHACSRPTSSGCLSSLPFAPHQDCFIGDAGGCSGENRLLHWIAC